MAGWRATWPGTLVFVLVLSLTLWSAACSGVPGMSKAAYPESPVTLIVPLSAGSTVERVFRALAEEIKPHFPQPISVVARPGGGGAIGVNEVVQARPDGYTICGFFSAALTILPHMSEVTYQPDSYRLVMSLVNMPSMFVVRADAPWKTLQEVLDYAKANPGKVRVGSSGEGTGSHFALEALKDLAKVDLTHVPHGGDPPSIAALLGGHQEASIAVPGTILAQSEANQVRVLATTGAERSPVFPDVPTLKELGYDYSRVSLIGILVPKATSDEVAKTLHDAFKKALETESFKDFARKTPVDLDYRGPEDTKKALDADYAYYGDLVKKLNLKK